VTPQFLSEEYEGFWKPRRRVVIVVSRIVERAGTPKNVIIFF
jgi:hypothetical protein